MTDPTPDIGGEHDHGASDNTPRWVKMFGTIALVLVLLFVALQVIGGGGHGPGRHVSSGDATSDAPPASVTEDHPAPVEHGGQRP